MTTLPRNLPIPIYKEMPQGFQATFLGLSSSATKLLPMQLLRTFPGAGHQVPCMIACPKRVLGDGACEGGTGIRKADHA